MRRPNSQLAIAAEFIDSAAATAADALQRGVDDCCIIAMPADPASLNAAVHFHNAAPVGSITRDAGELMVHELRTAVAGKQTDGDRVLLVATLRTTAVRVLQERGENRTAELLDVQLPAGWIWLVHAYRAPGALKPDEPVEFHWQVAPVLVEALDA